MLPKKLRLPLKQTEFPKNAFKRIESRFFRLYLIKTEDSKGAIIVSKKQISKSTNRNLLKRRISMFLPEIINSLHNISMVVWVKKTCLSSTIDEMREIIINQLKDYYQVK